MACRKAAYPNVRSARTALNQCKKARGHSKRRHERSMYKCELCGDWHLTSEAPNDLERFT